MIAGLMFRPWESLSLFFALFGWFLLVRVLIAGLLEPPPRGIPIWQWLMMPSYESSLVVLRQPFLYAGLVCLFVSDIFRILS